MDPKEIDGTPPPATESNGWNGDDAPVVLNLAKDFPVPSYERWREVVDKDLAGADFDKKLIWRTLEGIDVEPIYTRKHIDQVASPDGLPGFPPFKRGNYPLSGVRVPWQIRQDCLLEAPESVNGALRDGLARGQNAVAIRLDNAARRGLDGDHPDAADLAGVGGCTMSSINGLRIALADIDFNKFPISIRTGTSALPVLAMLLALAEERGLSRLVLVGGVECDPLRDLIKAGRNRAPLDHLYREMADMVSYCARECPGIRPVMVNSHPYHNAGASAVQELGYTLAAAIEYMRAMTVRGVSPDDAARGMAFSFSVGTSLFMEIAKLRAARMLWAKIVKAFGPKADNDEALKMFLHVRTSSHTKTANDPYNNLIRSAVEGFAAAVAGCDSMYVAPFDEPIGRATEFSQRLARNQQLLLRDEAYLSKVVDPSAGSFYVEFLTDSIAKAAWELVQKVEAEGGMSQCIADGKVQEAVNSTAAKRAKLISGRRMPIVGVSNYPNPSEKPLQKRPISRDAFLAERRKRLSRLKSVRRNSRVRELLSGITRAAYSGEGNLLELGVRAAASGATIGEIIQALNRGSDGEPLEAERLPSYRDSVAFEILRERASEAAQSRGGELEKVFLVPMGPLAMRKARAGFCWSFFGAGGFQVIEPNGFEDIESAAEAIVESGARVAVPCSDDPSYPEIVPGLIQRVREKNKDILFYVAGYPQDSVEILKEAGVDGFVHLKADAVETLEKLQERLGMTASVPDQA